MVGAPIARIARAHLTRGIDKITENDARYADPRHGFRGERDAAAHTHPAEQALAADILHRRIRLPKYRANLGGEQLQLLRSRIARREQEAFLRQIGKGQLIAFCQRMPFGQRDDDPVAPEALMYQPCFCDLADQQCDIERATFHALQQPCAIPFDAADVLP